MNIKYCIITTEANVTSVSYHINAVDLCQWKEAFRGLIRHADEILPVLKDNDFDIIHITVHADNLDLINKIRDKLGEKSRTKLVVNIDHYPEYWKSEFGNISPLFKAVSKADLIITTEYSLAKRLESELGKKVYELPNPYMPEKLQAYPLVNKKKIISIIYGNNSPAIILLKAIFFLLGNQVRVLSFNGNPADKRLKNKTMTKRITKECRSEAEFYTGLAESELVFALHSQPDFGGLILYAASCGVPVIGNLNLDTMRRCYPFTSVEKINLFSCLLYYFSLKINFQFREYIVQVAKNKLAYYYPDNLVKRFLDLLYFETNDARFEYDSMGPEQNVNANMQKKVPHFYKEIYHIYGPQKVNYKQDECALVCLVKDGSEYIKTFMTHYRKLGIKHFYFIDNGSTDDTIFLLKQYPSVSIYQTRLEHKKYETEIRQMVIEANCRYHWCLSVDIDELFDFPYSDSISLKDLLIYLHKYNYTAVIAYMLDMFPEKLIAEQNNEEFERTHCYFDITRIKKANYYSHNKAFCNYNRLANPKMPYYYGGIRKKIFRNFGIKYLLIKHPLMFIDNKIDAVVNPHFCNKASIADISGLIKHYKFLSSFKDKIQKTYNNYDFFAEKEYKTYIKIFKKNNNLSLFSSYAKKLSSVNNLINDDFLIISGNYLKFISAMEENF